MRTILAPGRELEQEVTMAVALPLPMGMAARMGRTATPGESSPEREVRALRMLIQENDYVKLDSEGSDKLLAVKASPTQTLTVAPSRKMCKDLLQENNPVKLDSEGRDKLLAVKESPGL